MTTAAGPETGRARPAPTRIALVGDRSPSVQAHLKIPLLVRALATTEGPIEIYWLRSTTVTAPSDVAGFDGIWVIPGSPYENRDGVLAALESARTNRIPMLGTCGGFQHLLLEFARSVCGLGDVEHGEQFPEAGEQIIIPLECSLLGEEAPVAVTADTCAAAAMGAGVSTERFFCRYGLNPSYLAVLERHGLLVSGRDEHGDARIVELPDHPFYVGSLFQPELSSDSTFVHPLIRAFVGAARAHSGGASRSDGTARRDSAATRR